MAADERNPWRVLRRETLFDCHHFAVRQDTVSHAARAPRPYNSVRLKHHGVAVAAIDRHACVVLVGQYRYVLERYTWEIPGGGAAVTADPLAIARSELHEETGCRAHHWLKMVGGASSPGSLDEVTSGYVAWGLEEGEAQPEPEELLTLRRVPFAEAVAMALGGEIGNTNGTALLLAIQVRLTRHELPEDLMALLEGGVTSR